MTLEQVLSCLPTLDKLSRCKTKKQREKVLSGCKLCVYKAIGEISKNFLLKNIPVSDRTIKKLSLHKKYIRLLASKTPLKTKKYIVNQKGGFSTSLLIPALFLYISCRYCC